MAIKKYAVLFFVIALAFGYFLFRNSNKINNRDMATSDNAAAYAVKQVKKTCNLFYGLKENNEYQNTEIGFSFKYPKGTVICERLFSKISPDYGTEISVWNMSDFAASVPKNGPRIIIRIDKQLTNERLNRIAGKGAETKLLGGKQVSKIYAQRATCVRQDCPIFPVYKFKYNGHSFVIEERKKDETIINSFKFSAAAESLPSQTE